MISSNKGHVKIDGNGVDVVSEIIAANISVLKHVYKTTDIDFAREIFSTIVAITANGFEKETGEQLAVVEDELPEYSTTEDSDNDEFPEIFMDKNGIQEFLKEGGFLF